MNNPFVYGEVVTGEDFADRQEEIASLLQDLKERRPILGPIAAKLITLLLPRPNGILDRKYNFYVGEHLTHNFSYTNLKVIRKPTTYSLTKDLIRRIRNNEPFVYIDKDTTFTQWPDQDINYRGFLYKAISKIPKINPALVKKTHLDTENDFCVVIFHFIN